MPIAVSMSTASPIWRSKPIASSIWVSSVATRWTSPAPLTLGMTIASTVWPACSTTSTTSR